jgi:hypothetical protein
MSQATDFKIGEKILVKAFLKSLYQKYWVEVEITDIDENLPNPIQIFGELWYSLKEIKKTTSYEPNQTNQITN